MSTLLFLFNPLPDLMRNSVLHTGKLLREAEHEVFLLSQYLDEQRREVKRLTEMHREQIARSLLSKSPEEKRMAESIATYYEVPLPE